jgi:Outer membrane lipoprotein-sorting protein
MSSMKQAVQRSAFIAAVCALLLPADRLSAAPAARPTAESLVQAYNARDFGSPGWRRIILELKNHGKVTRTFSIVHLWREAAGEIRSLVHLEEPAGLRGTNYLLLEGPQLAHGMELFLSLPSGQRRVLNVKPGRFDEGLLGSDFTYRDLLWRIPTEGYRLRLAGRTRMLNRRAWGVDVEPVTEAARASSSWSRVRYYLGHEPALLLGADFFRGEEARPGKRLRTESFARRQGVSTPTRLVMQLAGGRSSVLSLHQTAFGSGRFDDDLFVPDLLPTATERVAASIAESRGGAR